MPLWHWWVNWGWHWGWVDETNTNTHVWPAAAVLLGGAGYVGGGWSDEWTAIFFRVIRQRCECWILKYLYAFLLLPSFPVQLRSNLHVFDNVYKLQTRFKIGSWTSLTRMFFVVKNSKKELNCWMLQNTKIIIISNIKIIFFLGSSWLNA